jgi:hypothetical protein
MTKFFSLLAICALALTACTTPTYVEAPENPSIVFNVLSEDGAKAYCAKLSGKKDAIACAIPPRKEGGTWTKCIVLLPSYAMKLDAQGAPHPVLVHEVKHCYGWRHP